ncbi:MAG TPA: MotA/TolQ/ExbB proton channel family protein [Paracoccaceae bacterium]
MTGWHEAAVALHGFIQLGGWVVALLLALSVLAGAVVLAKLWQFRRAGVGRQAGLRGALSLWEAGQRGEALRTAQAMRGPLAPVAARAMAVLRSGSGSGSGDGVGARALRERLHAEAEEAMAGLESGLRLLDAVTQIAPLLGLFGTVLGMIDAFQSMQGAGASVDPSVLAGGIWVALLTTAVGLAVAMPVSVLLTWFESLVARERRLAEVLVEVVCGPALLVRQGPAATPAANPHVVQAPAATVAHG